MLFGNRRSGSTTLITDHNTEPSMEYHRRDFNAFGLCSNGEVTLSPKWGINLISKMQQTNKYKLNNAAQL